MTVLDFFKNNDVEAIANQIIHNDVMNWAFDIDYGGVAYFQEAKECPIECEFLESGYKYEWEDLNGRCNLGKNELCPYRIDRNEVVKKQIIKWLQHDIDKI